MSRAPSDSLDAKSWESNLANLIFKAISIIPGIFLSRLVVCCLRRYGAGCKKVSPKLQNGGLRALLLDGRVLDTSGVNFYDSRPIL